MNKKLFQNKKSALEYIKSGIETGLLWPFEIKDIKNNIWMAVYIKDEEVLTLNNEKVQTKKDGVFIFNEEEIKYVNFEYFKNNFNAMDKNDFYQIYKAIKMLKINKKPIEVYRASQYNKIEHENKAFIFDQLEDKRKKGLMSAQEIVNYEKLMTAIKSGKKITLTPVSDYLASKMPIVFQKNNISFISLTTMMRLDVAGPAEFDIDAIIENDKDNLLITLEDDFETINLLLENERPLEVADKVTNIDAMSIEELLAFKSLLTGYMVTQKNIDYATILERIQEQLKQEVAEKNDIYGPCAENDYKDLVL